MKLDDFYVALTELLEIEDTLTSDSDLTTYDEYDSMALMGIVAFVNSNFNCRIAGAALQKVRTVADLVDLIGKDQFSK